MNIIQSINNYLSEEGISQHKIAEKCGMTDVTISNLLSFNRKMYYHKFLKVLDAVYFKIINEARDEVNLTPKEIIPHIMHYMREHELKQNQLAGIIEVSNSSICQFFGYDKKNGRFQRYMAYNKFIQVLLLTGFKILDRDGNIVIGNDVEQDIEDHFYNANEEVLEQLYDSGTKTIVTKEELKKNGFKTDDD